MFEFFISAQFGNIPGDHYKSDIIHIVDIGNGSAQVFFGAAIGRTNVGVGDERKTERFYLSFCGNATSKDEYQYRQI